MTMPQPGKTSHEDVFVAHLVRIIRGLSTTLAKEQVRLSTTPDRLTCAYCGCLNRPYESCYGCRARALLRGATW